jgi:DNA repair protein RadC
MDRPDPIFSARLDRPEIRRFLVAALALDRPESAALGPAVPIYDALPLLKRLREAGECNDDGWDPQIRAWYQSRLMPLGQTSEPITDSSVRGLARLDESDRPREKALRSGVGELNDDELIAILLGTGGKQGVMEAAHAVLLTCGGLAGLARTSLQALQEITGIGEAKACELAVACEIGRRLAEARLRERPEISAPETVAALMAPLIVSLDHERLWVLPLDVRRRLIGAPRQVTQGDVDGTEAGPRIVLRSVLAAGAVAFVVVHNHPSGDPTPSSGDLVVTRRLVAAARVVDVTCEDHVVLAAGGACVSMRRDHPELWRA